MLCIEEFHTSGSSGCLPFEPIRRKSRLEGGSDGKLKKRQVKGTTTTPRGQAAAELLRRNTELTELFDRAYRDRRAYSEGGTTVFDFAALYSQTLLPALLNVFRVYKLDCRLFIYVESSLFHLFVEGEPV